MCFYLVMDDIFGLLSLTTFERVSDSRYAIVVSPTYDNDYLMILKGFAWKLSELKRGVVARIG